SSLKGSRAMSSKPLQYEQIPNATNVTDPKESEALDTQRVVLPPPEPVDEDRFYTYEDDLDEEVVPQIAPFGVSQEMPTVLVGEQSSEQIVTPAQSPAPRSSAKRPSLMFVAIIVCVVVIVG